MLTFSIEPVWSRMRNIIDEIEKTLHEKNIAIADLAVTAASELMENAVKYGETNKNEQNDEIDFDMDIQDKKIRISVSNYAVNRENIDNVVMHINEIQKSNDPAELYTRRLQELMDNTVKGNTQLGLYRIAYEGEFSLSYKLEKNRLTIIAEREL
jgi:hypothetical protein